MIEAISTSNTGLNASQQQLNTTGNNLANLNTTGFKANLTTFQDLIYTTLATPVAAGKTVSPPGGTQIGQGVMTSSTDKQFTQGPLESTGQPYNVAIDGNGFFQVTGPGGAVYYTRDGTFQINSTGRLVTANGHIVQPPIVVPANATSVTIGTDGTVSVLTPGSSTPKVVGQLTLVRFANPPGLNSEGNNLFTATSSSGSPVTGTPGQSGSGLLRQGFLEGSNVDPTTELANLLIAQQWFVANSHGVQVASQMLSDTTDLVK